MFSYMKNYTWNDDIAKICIDNCVKWIRNWFDRNGKGCNAIIGISGGKDSTIAAALCVKALGKDRVIGVLMPNGGQSDIIDAYDVLEALGIKHRYINIKGAYNDIIGEMRWQDMNISNDTKINLAPRLRMATLYAVAQSENGRVVNTCNLSEDYVGYSTRYGDSVGDFSPLSGFTVTELLDIGRLLGLPEFLVKKTPSDGLCGQSDEDKLGFTYAELDEYIRCGRINNQEHKDKIDRLHKQNEFKLKLMESFIPFNEEVEWDGLVADYCSQQGITYLIRGLRNNLDYSYEENLAKINSRLNSKLSTVYFRSSAKWETCSSSLVRELWKTRCDLTREYLPKNIYEYLEKKGE